MEQSKNHFNIVLNGEPHEVKSGNLATLLEELGLHDRRCATMVNGEIVRRDARAERPLAQGDAVDVIAMVGGG